MSKLHIARPTALYALTGLWFFMIFPVSIGFAQAGQEPSTISTITPASIDFQGTYELIKPFDTFEPDPSEHDLDLNTEEVFSGLFRANVRWVRIETLGAAADSFLVRTYTSEAFPSKPQTAGQGTSAAQAVGQFEAKLVHGLRGTYCSIEVVARRQKSTEWTPFYEYYLVLALGFRDEQSLWLGPANTPADAAGGKHIRFIMIKISD